MARILLSMVVLGSSLALPGCLPEEASDNSLHVDTGNPNPTIEAVDFPPRDPLEHLTSSSDAAHRAGNVSSTMGRSPVLIPAQVSVDATSPLGTIQADHAANENIAHWRHPSNRWLIVDDNQVDQLTNVGISTERFVRYRLDELMPNLAQNPNFELHNLVPNRGFEERGSTFPNGKRAPLNWRLNDPNKADHSYLEIGGGRNAGSRNSVKISGVGVSEQVYWLSDPVAISPSTAYVLHGWGKGQNWQYYATMDLGIEWLDNNDWIISTSFSPGVKPSEWAVISTGTVVSPVNAHSARLVARQNYGAHITETWFDDVSFKEAGTTNPDGWAPHQPNGSGTSGTFEWDDGVSRRSGAHALKISDVGISDQAYWLSDAVAIDPSEKYTMYGWGMGKNWSTYASMGVGVYWYDANGNYISYAASQQYTSPEGEWVQMATPELTPPSNAASARLFCRHNYGSPQTQVWFDDIAFHSSTYRFDLWDELIEKRVNQQGIDIKLVLHGSPAYLASQPEQSYSFPTDPDAWGNHAREIVQHFVDAGIFVKYWDLISEPDDLNWLGMSWPAQDTINLINSAAAKMKMADPNILVGFNLAQYTPSWFNIYLDTLAIENHLDFFSWHNYWDSLLTTGVGETTDELWMDRTSQLGLELSTAKSAIAAKGLQGQLETCLTEYNVHGGGSVEWHRNTVKGAVWFTSALKHIAENNFDSAVPSSMYEAIGGFGILDCCYDAIGDIDTWPSYGGYQMAYQVGGIGKGSKVLQSTSDRTLFPDALHEKLEVVSTQSPDGDINVLLINKDGSESYEAALTVELPYSTSYVEIEPYRLNGSTVSDAQEQQIAADAVYHKQVGGTTLQNTVSLAPHEVIGLKIRPVGRSFSLDKAPTGWTLDSGWAVGKPSGAGGTFGGPDPSSGYSGDNVLGYNLDGDYGNYLSPKHATTAAIDCSQLNNTRLKFQRWLNVERSFYDHATISVSNDGAAWTEIYHNPPHAHVQDSSWQAMDYDISAIADGQSTVYIRWTMGTTDSSWTFSGWNIDDIRVEGDPL